MRARLTEFVQHLRSEGLAISIAETLDALAAVKKAGIDPIVLREALAATLVKDELDRDRFDATFDAFFAAPPHGTGVPGRRRSAAGGGEAGAGGSGRPSGAGAGGGSSRPPEDTPTPAASSEARRSPRDRPAGLPGAPQPGERATDATRSRPADRPRTAEMKPSAERARSEPKAPFPRQRGDALRPTIIALDAGHRRTRGALSERREILRKPFDALSPDDLDEAREIARELGRRFAARASRRERRRRAGRIDVRRTIRASLGRGGAMIVLQRRGRRPGKPRLVVLCDVSGSVARASELLLSILASAESAFRRVTRFVFVDRLVPVAYEDGHILPDGELDLWARSDFGAVLRDAAAADAIQLDRSTVLLVLGDARNNRLPPRADVWKRLALRARAVVWIVPEPRARWDTGDSALAAYAPACDLVLEATSLHGLAAAVRAAARR